MFIISKFFLYDYVKLFEGFYSLGCESNCVFVIINILSCSYANMIFMHTYASNILEIIVLMRSHWNLSLTCMRLSSWLVRGVGSNVIGFLNKYFGWLGCGFKCFVINMKLSSCSHHRESCEIPPSDVVGFLASCFSYSYFTWK